jgi:hypothetical protein
LSDAVRFFGSLPGVAPIKPADLRTDGHAPTLESSPQGVLDAPRVSYHIAELTWLHDELNWRRRER